MEPVTSGFATVILGPATEVIHFHVVSVDCPKAERKTWCKEMKPPRIRLPLASLLLLSVCFFSRAGYAQQSTTPPQTTQPPADPIVGSWKLNIDKSINPIAERELITIARQGNQFQIIFQALQSNEYNPHYQVTTDMNGAISKLVQADGKPMSDEWRVTRTQPNAFVVESVGPFGGSKEEYAVSVDGKTLTVHELPDSAPKLVAGKTDSNGVFHRFEQVLVFEKISDSEGRALSQKMTDTDVAQKALAAEKAAAQAALDATACSLASGQSEAPASIPNQTAWHEYICPKDGFGISLPNTPQEQSLERFDFYKLFMTEDESIVAQLWVSAESVDCAAWLQGERSMVNRPLPLGMTSGTTETTFQGSPAFESVDRHTNGPMYLLYDLNQCSANRTFRFHARWLTDQSKPEEVTRIFDSFQLLTKPDKQ